MLFRFYIINLFSINLLIIISGKCYIVLENIVELGIYVYI